MRLLAQYSSFAHIFLICTICGLVKLANEFKISDALPWKPNFWGTGGVPNLYVRLRREFNAHN